MKQTSSEDFLPGRLGPVAGPARVGPGMLPTVLSPAELSQQLQTSLDLERILELFSRAILWAFPHDGFSYDHAPIGVHLSRGRLARHSCSYNLAVEGQQMGELRFLRGRKFREQELSELENMLVALMYPLRNALLYRQALRAAQTDPLTGIHNRAALDRLLPRELAAFQRAGQPLAMLVVDLDHFKRVNDTLGHTVGDRVLMAVARCLESGTRKSDMLFRSGGEEFVVLLHMAQAGHGTKAAERLRLALENCHGVQDAAPGFHPTASIGLALARADDTPLTLFDRADKAMYAAKQAGRNRVHLAA